MTYAEIREIENAGRTGMAAWAPEAYDGQTHYGYLVKATMPALGILALATALMFAIL